MSFQIPWFQSPPTSHNQSTTTGLQTFKHSPGGLLDPWYPCCSSGCSSMDAMDVYRSENKDWISQLWRMMSQLLNIHLYSSYIYMARFFWPKNLTSKTPCLHRNKNEIISNKSSNTHQTPSIENHKKNHRTSSKILGHHPKIIQTSNIQQVLRPVLRPVWIPSTSSAAWPAAIRRQWQSHRRSPCSRNWRRVGGQRAW